jgi:uncharacterized FAD-dependent dehydrogenase
MSYVDEVLCGMGGADAKLYSTANSELKTKALRYDLHLLDAKVRHFGTDRNVNILSNMFNYLKDKVEIKFNCEVLDVSKEGEEFLVKTREDSYSCKDLVLATGRSGSKWISGMCDKLHIRTDRNRVDIGVRIELPAEVFEHITKDVYESK